MEAAETLRTIQQEIPFESQDCFLTLPALNSQTID
jgi:hypothetical protein